ncbi:MAG: M1 family aminopeptidase [Candidatus Cloacimonetes bacterium]|nr:M1 family aminopeptidase [Candidatus Cloacimonadota bacterium]
MKFTTKLLWIVVLLAVFSPALLEANTQDVSASRKYLHLKDAMSFRNQTPARADSAHGFDVQKYEITLNINDATHFITGNVLATVVAENYLPSISYELSNLTVSSVLVNGAAAVYTHSNGIINISTNMAAGQQFTTQVFYSGIPALSSDIYHIGMIFGNNSVFTISDPDAGRMWYPCYDHPWDKAIVDLHITMRSDWKVAANGIRSGIVNNGNGTSTTHWLGSHPMTTYLVCFTAGPYQEIDQYVPSVNNLHIQNFVSQSQYNNALIDFQRTPQMVSYFSQNFGTYPFEKYGHATVNMSTFGAMEHQTMTTLGNFIITGNQVYEVIIAHELAHQWFGNAVSFLTFKDVWLSEGFATYSEHLWTDYRFGWQSACDYVATSFHQYYLNWENSSGAPSIYNPNFNNYFSPPSYEKAASVLHMLRLKIGNDNFFQLLQQWFETYKHQNAVTDEFKAMAEQISGMDLTQFFNQWIYGSGIPSVEYSVWTANDLDRLKIVAKTTSPTTTNFSVELPFKITYNTGSDSLLVVATPQGYSNQYLAGYTAEDFSILANHHNWALLRNVTEHKPVLSECLASNGSVLLAWEDFIPGTDSGYMIYRKQASSTLWSPLNSTPILDNFYVDTTVTNGISYNYKLQVLDNEGYMSLASNPMTALPQAFSFTGDLLVVDETRDGNGANINPDDAMVDAFYANALMGLSGTINNWDCTTQGAPTLEVLGQYRLVLWHADDFSQHLLQDNLSIISGYILGGGKLLLSGWKTPSVLTPAFLERFAGGITLNYDNSACLISATPSGDLALASLFVDPLKTIASWNGMLPYIYTFSGVQTPLYTANLNPGSAGNGLCAAFRHDTNGTLVMFGFPLYYMQAEGVCSLLQELLPQLNPALPIGEEPLPQKAVSLSCNPNPFNPSTTISYYLPVSGETTLSLYNLKGQRVRDLASGIKANGNHTIVFDGMDIQHRSLASGVYLLHLKHPQGNLRQKITLLK